MSSTPWPTRVQDAQYDPRLARRRTTGTLFGGVCLLFTLSAMATLFLLLGAVVAQGWNVLSATFFTNFPSALDPSSAGLKSAIWGTAWIIVLTALFSVPTGVGAAIYLEEYAPQNWFTRFIRLNIANLAGVPSIVYGILGLALFVRWLEFDRSVLSGALTMSLLILPVVIIASREAISAVPNTIRQAAYALGATRWQTIRHHVLPAALPGILTGMILSLSRAIGETAPLIMIGAGTYIAFTPGGSFWDEYAQTPAGFLSWLKAGLFDQFTAMPLQIYNWAAQPQPEFHRLAAGGIVVLLAILLTMNAAAVVIRAWQQSKHR